jgi:phytoene dehydrogenase-like protein
MQQQGLSVLLLEGKAHIGGGMRTAKLTLPGYLHDVCSAIHPLAAASPFFKKLPLQQFGLQYIYPDIAAAHPFDNGTAAFLQQSIKGTAQVLGRDSEAYQRLMEPLVHMWPDIVDDILGPLHYPQHPLHMAHFGLKAITSASHLAKQFRTEEAKGLLAGMAAHSMQPLSNIATSAVGLVLLINGHIKGWPLPQGGSVKIADALAAYFVSIGGKIETNIYVSSLDQLPPVKALLFDVTPRQLLTIAGHRFSNIYKWQLERYRYGMGVFKVDWALDDVIPFTAADVKHAGTIHIGGTFNEIACSEGQTAKGIHPDKPFVLLSQPSLFDKSRAPEGKHTAWAYCHVPAGSVKDMAKAIEQQVERFAPGFRERILARHTFNTQQMEEHNPNYIGGDINGGAQDIRQLFTRPVLRRSPYNTSAKGIYICSSSTPPGGGVHGMCGYHAAKRALKEVFGIRVSK